MRKLLIFTLVFSLGATTFAFSQYRVKNEPLPVTEENAGYSFMQPRWSPDGSKIAVTADRYNGIWIAEADGSGMSQLTDDQSAGYGFEWSSDSKAIISRIAQYEGFRRYNAIKMYDVSTGASKLLSDVRTSMSGLPQWFDNDQKVIIFSDNVLEIFETGRNVSSLNKSKRASSVFFLKDDYIGKADLDSKEIIDLAPVENERYLNLTMSPDQSKLAFEVMGGSMYVINTDGTGLIDLGTGFRPQWAPDSRHLVYMVTQDDGHQYVSSDIQIIDIYTKEISRLSFATDKLEMNPSWSPQGDKIAFDVMDEGKVYVIELTK
ncbi:PD40 domain-containing protein [candidate division KSB1 bacterium]|nr:PD40 domain-containing protein [candidate division KSB1 bacterium]